METPRRSSYTEGEATIDSISGFAVIRCLVSVLSGIFSCTHVSSERASVSLPRRIVNALSCCSSVSGANVSRRTPARSKSASSMPIGRERPTCLHRLPQHEVHWLSLLKSQVRVEPVPRRVERGSVHEQPRLQPLHLDHDRHKLGVSEGAHHHLAHQCRLTRRRRCGDQQCAGRLLILAATNPRVEQPSAQPIHVVGVGELRTAEGVRVRECEAQKVRRSDGRAPARPMNLAGHEPPSFRATRPMNRLLFGRPPPAFWAPTACFWAPVGVALDGDSNALLPYVEPFACECIQDVGMLCVQRLGPPAAQCFEGIYSQLARCVVPRVQHERQRRLAFNVQPVLVADSLQHLNISPVTSATPYAQPLAGSVVAQPERPAGAEGGYRRI
eukprot:5196234-Prymnesium_polylepis.1